MYIFLCKNRNRYLLILEEFHGQTTVIFEKIGHFARFWLGNSFGASFPVICPWKTIKIDRNMKNKRAYPFIFQYFNFYFSSSFFAFEPTEQRWYTMKSMAYFTPNQEKSRIPVPGFCKFPSIFDLQQYFGEDKTHLRLSRCRLEVYLEDSGLKMRLKLAYWIYWKRI